MSTYRTTQIHGIAGLAVRLGRALERWGVQAAEPLSRDELRRRRAIHIVHDEAVEARRSSLIGAHPYLR